MSPQARKSSSRRRSSQKKDEEPQVDRQGSKTDGDSQQSDQTTETASSSPPVEKTKPEGEESVTPYQPSHPTLQNAGLDQQAAEEARQAELQAERDEHNRRTGDVSR